VLSIVVAHLFDGRDAQVLVVVARHVFSMVVAHLFRWSWLSTCFDGRGCDLLALMMA